MMTLYDTLGQLEYVRKNDLEQRRLYSHCIAAGMPGDGCDHYSGNAVHRICIAHFWFFVVNPITLGASLKIKIVSEDSCRRASLSQTLRQPVHMS
jgi:hypothetical protein